MNIKNNKRLNEVALALYFNYLNNIKSKIDYDNLIRMFNSLVGAFGKDYLDAFKRMYQDSINDKLMDATVDEIVATEKTFFSQIKLAKLLGISRSTYLNNYNKVCSKDILSKQFLDNLKPKYGSDIELEITYILGSFIRHFAFKFGNDDCPIMRNDRSLEIEFWLIYNKLLLIFNNTYICDKFMYNLCLLMDIDYSSVSQLRNNTHIITRSYPSSLYGQRYFRQEIVYLYTKKGLGKSQIGTHIFDRDSTFLFNGTNKYYTKLTDEDASWQYAPTIDWSNINREAIKNFINVFHSFIIYDV